jgi:hypothetical protein
MDVVKMIRLHVPPHAHTERLTPRCREMANLVYRPFNG